MACKICVLSTKLHKCVAFHENWLQLHGEKDAVFSSYTSVDSELATCAISSIDELCHDCEGGGFNGKEQEGDKCDLELLLLQPMLLMALLNCSFMHTALVGINILNLELVVFHLERKVFN
jgi:hypothetical protein